MSPVPLPGLARITYYGQYGVDLFFVLSGWLIGGLYWRELNSFGSVDVLRFWKRRWMRTIPPYLAALVASWLAVRLARGEPFDWGYLLFMQNYYERIPYFLVSWSLCIEEHFYLVAPLATGALLFFVPSRLWWPAWILALGVSPLSRWFEWSPNELGDFGYSITASHLRFDGLIMGFGLSYFATFAPASLVHGARWSPSVILVILVALVGLELSGGVAHYVCWPMSVSFLFATIIVAERVWKAEPVRVLPVTFLIPWTSIALASYSAYLMHPLAIHAARSAASVAGRPNYWLVYWPLVILIITAATWLFYAWVEKPAIALRDAWVPVRAKSKSPSSWAT